MTTETIEFSDTALIKVSPESDESVKSLQVEVRGLLHYAEGRVIATDADAKSATEDLSLLSKLKKAIADKRKDWLTPIKEKLDAVDAVFKSLSTPLDQADKTTRSKIMAYRAEQERKAREAEEINRLRMEAAKKEMELKGELTESVNLVEVAPAQPKTVHTEVGSAGMRDNWTYEVVDFVALPNEYKVADTAMLNSIAKKYHDQKQVPGVKFTNKPILAISAR